ncbi:MAG TPA: glycosyltransferase family 2 protein [Gemmataceae bacterium]
MKPSLSVIVPVYNEAATVDEILARLRDGPYPDKQVIVVDDGSTDGTGQRLAAWASLPSWIIVRHDRNRGKGAAVRTGLAYAAAEVTVIQDADLEYDPRDLPRLVEPVRRGEAAAVYGSRYLRPSSPGLLWGKHRLAVAGLNLLVAVLYGQRLTDEATCYKVLRTDLLRSLRLEASRFELCPEMTAKLCRLGVRIREEPISYRPRTAAEGKKIGWADAVQAVWTLLRWRFAPAEFGKSALNV